KAHADMLAWHASCDQLVGPTRLPRPYSQGMPLPPSGILDDKDLVAYWGDEVTSMGAKAMAILMQTGILVRVAKSRAQEHIKPENIVAAQLAFVEFGAGTGKYEDGKARLRWPHSLPCRIPPPKKVVENTTWWPVVSITFIEEEERCLAKYMTDEASEDIEFHACERTAIEEMKARPIEVACKALILSCQEQLQWEIPAACTSPPAPHW
ncbi:MAG: hypothetical protein ACKPKO_23150, partial [Candidatus Fonsibacter sp.]